MVNKATVEASFTTPENLNAGKEYLSGTGFRLLDYYSPHPLFDEEESTGQGTDRITVPGFIVGILGAATAFLIQGWISTKSYPLEIGGKPIFSWLSFIPITFETGILLGAVTMFIAFLVVTRMGSGIERVYPLTTGRGDDEYVIRFEVENGLQDGKLDELENVLRSRGAVTVQVINIQVRKGE